VRHAGERFDVVDYCWLGECAGDRGDGGLFARPAALAFERFEQAGFFAADVGASAFVDVALELVLAAEDSLWAEDFVVVGFLDRALEDFGLAMVFAADEDVSDVAARGDGCDGDCLRASDGGRNPSGSDL